MSDKHLTEKSWKSLAGDQDVSDNGLQRALAVLERALGGEDSQKALDALAEVESLAAKLRKSVSAKKEVCAYLDDLLKEAAKKRKALASQLEESSAEAEGEEDEEDESGSPGEVLAKALKKVKTAGGDPTFAAMVCPAKPLCGVVVGISPKKVLGSKHKAQLKESTGGSIVLEGRCLWEENAITFVLEKPSGLAKRLKAAIQAATGTLYKVRVRNADGSLVSDDATDPEGMEGEGGTPPVAPPTAPVDAQQKEAFTRRMAALKPDLVKAIAANSPKSEEIKKGAVEAGHQAAKNHLDVANRLLDAVERMIKETLAKTGTPGGAKSKPPVSPPSSDQRNDPVPPTGTPPVTPPPTTGGGTPPVTPPTTTPPTTPPPVTPPVMTPPVNEFDKEVKPVQDLLDTLAGHAQHAHAQGEIDAAKLKITEAKNLASATPAKLKEARAALAAAKVSITTGQKAADAFAGFVKARAEAEVLLHSTREFYKDASHLDTLITEATALAAPGQRKFPQALAKLEKLRKELQGMLTKWYSESVKPRIKKLKAHASAKFLATPIQEIEVQFASNLSDLAAQNWRRLIFNGPKVNKLLTDAEKVAERRKAYDAARPAAAKAVLGAKKFPTVATPADALEKRLEAADTDASLESRHFENAVEELKAIELECAALIQAGPDAEAFKKDRPSADSLLQTLSSHAAAATVKLTLDGVRAQLVRADALAADLKTIKPAREALAQAKKDLAAVEKVLAAAAALQATADGAKDAAGVKKAVAALRAQAKAAGKGKPSDAVKAAVQAVNDALDTAEQLGKDGKPAEAAAPLKQAADLLAGLAHAAAAQADHATQSAALDKRLQALLKLPAAAALKPKTDLLAAALADAKVQLDAQAWDKMAAALSTAEDAARDAEAQAKLRAAYDDRLKNLKNRIKAATLTGPQTSAIDGDVLAADTHADGFDFVAAHKSLDGAGARLESAAIELLVTASPVNKNSIKASVQSMMKQGGAKQVDDLIQRLPDDVPMDVLTVLAKERFGVDFKVDADTSEALRGKAGKRMLLMLAKVPEDVVKNPSLKVVERREPGKDGGFYRGSENLVVMNGRVGQASQDFGSGIASQLPADVEDECKPVDETAVDYFDFATLHEVGHSVDDNLNFMGSREEKAEFGGWKTYGGNVAPIAEEVAKWAKYNSTPEQKKCVLDLILGNKVDWPTAPVGKETEWADAQKAVTDWHALAKVGNTVWWKQGDCDKITVGPDKVIYQEAYARNWVSYEAAARKQAITGYQFRAPGEWFAELYASYRIGKLKDSHPAVKWLSKIKV